MSALILPHRWRQQPQVPVSIDWGNPLAKDLIGAMNPGAGIDHVSGSGIVWQGPKINAQASGPGVYLNGATNSVPYVPVNFDLNTPMTLLSVTSVTSVSASKALFGFTNTGSVNPLCSMSANISTGVITSLYRSSTGSIKSQLTTQCTRSLVVPNQGDAVVAVMTHSSGATGCRAFVDGVLDGTNSAVNATASTPVNRMVMNGSIRTTTVGNTGAMYLGLAWRRALSDAEVAAISENPWQIFRPIRRRIWVPVSAGGAGITGTGAGTLGSFTGSAAGAVAIAGASSLTLGGFSGSAVGSVRVTGAASTTLDTFTQAAAATISVAGGQAATLGGFTGSAAGGVAVVGAGSATLAQFTGTASGTVSAGGAITGTSSQTLGAFTGAAAGVVAVAGAVASTLGQFSQVFLGVVTSAAAQDVRTVEVSAIRRSYITRTMPRQYSGAGLQRVDQVVAPTRVLKHSAEVRTTR